MVTNGLIGNVSDFDADDPLLWTAFAGGALRRDGPCFDEVRKIKAAGVRSKALRSKGWFAYTVMANSIAAQLMEKSTNAAIAVYGVKKLSLDCKTDHRNTAA
jgi:hypothetical protein